MIKTLKYIIWTIISLFLISCNNSGNSSTEIEKENQLSSPPVELENDNSNDVSVSNETIVDTAKLIEESYWDLLSGRYEFDEDYKAKLPNLSSDYFTNLDFPIHLKDSFSIDYYCSRLKFGFKDFFVFNKLNEYSICEYAALTDTSGFVQIIAQQCTDMEMWLRLFVIDGNYKIIDSELLMLSGGGLDEDPEQFGLIKVAKYSDFDSLTYYKKKYILKLNEVYSLIDANGSESKEIGYRKIKILTVDNNGLIQQKDSLIEKKDYVKYNRRL